jgi:hypothetical protein
MVECKDDSGRVSGKIRIVAEASWESYPLIVSFGRPIVYEYMEA